MCEKPDPGLEAGESELLSLDMKALNGNEAVELESEDGMNELTLPLLLAAWLDPKFC